MQHHVHRDRTWNNHKTQSPKNACRTISTEERCRHHCFKCISVSACGSDQRTWLHKLHTWIPRDCMIRLKTNQSSQPHTTSTENRNQFAIQPLHLSIADFYTQTLLHTEAFTHRSFYTQRLLHTEDFTQQTLLHTDGFTHRPAHVHALTLKSSSSWPLQQFDGGVKFVPCIRWTCIQYSTGYRSIAQTALVAIQVAKLKIK